MLIRFYMLLTISVLLAQPNSIAQNFGGNVPNTNWKKIESLNSRIIFPEGSESKASRINSVMMLLDSSTSQSIGTKRKKWNVVLQNETTIPNAYVRLAPTISELYMTPPQNSFSTGSIRWDDNLIVHEHRHMQQLSNFNAGFTRVFSFLLGEEGQLLANGITIPDYFFEGDAVWQETLVTKQGRGRMPYFYNGLKALWIAEKKYSWSKLRSGSYKDYTPDHYLLGYVMVAYGYEKYGFDFWKKVTNDAVNFKGIFYSFNKAIERYSGKKYSNYRSDALSWFRERSLQSDTTETLKMITPSKENNVTDYSFPVFINKDSIIVSKRSFSSVDAFYGIYNGKETKIRIRNTGLDEYFSYSNGKIVYCSYQSDPRYANRDYSVIQMVDTRTGKQRQLSFKSKYFSPDLNDDASKILVVEMDRSGSNRLIILDSKSGKKKNAVPNPDNYFFTQSKFITNDQAISAVRDSAGKMGLVKVDMITGATETLTPFSYNVIGYPLVKNDTVYFSAMNLNSDKIFALSLSSRRIFRLTGNVNGVYFPAVGPSKNLIFSAFTHKGMLLAEKHLQSSDYVEISPEHFANGTKDYTSALMLQTGVGIIDSVTVSEVDAEKYRKSSGFFNFHSRRPIIDEPEYGYGLLSDNILTNFSSAVNYTYNRNENSHSLGFQAIYGGIFPVISAGVSSDFNRQFIEANGNVKRYNAAKFSSSVTIPLSFIGGRTNKFFNVGAGYNMEQLYYDGIDKNIFGNRSFHYVNSFVSFSNLNRQAKQQVAPRWAQTITAGYRYALTNRDNRKLVANSRFFFPGLFKNHSLMLNGTFQKRDTLADLFSNTFAYSRGYTALNSRRMYKWAVNYQLPVAYPDFGFGNIIFFQRVRAVAFYDHSNARARLNGTLADILNRSAGTEIYFDTKVWNSLPVSFGVRYSRLLDKDLRLPGETNRWEFIIPIGFIPD